MRSRQSIALLAALAFVITLVTAVETSAQSATSARAVQVAQGENQKIQGVVSIRSGDSFKVREPGGNETSVLMTGDTKVSSHSRGLRGKKEYPVTYIMRGLRVQAQGVGDAEGNLVAEWVRFDDRPASAHLSSRQMNWPKNCARLKAAERMRSECGQIAENTASQGAKQGRCAQAQAEAAFNLRVGKPSNGSMITKRFANPSSLQVNTAD